MAKVDKVNSDGTVDVIFGGDLWRNLETRVEVNKGDIVRVDDEVEVVLCKL